MKFGLIANSQKKQSSEDLASGEGGSGLVVVVSYFIFALDESAQPFSIQK